MSPREVFLVDYGLGNLMSVSQALGKVGAQCHVTRDPEKLRHAERIILPGVGAFGVAMAHLQEFGLDQSLKDAAGQGVPILGICLGMQLLFDSSSEFGVTKGLGLVPGEVTQLRAVSTEGATLRQTHIGWRELQVKDAPHHSLLARFEQESSFYFVHSFGGQTLDPAHTLSIVEYGDQEVAAIVAVGNVAGVQFHPEKSGPAGLNFLESFLDI